MTDTGSAGVGKQNGSLSRYAPEYLTRATEMLVREGEDGYLLRIEARRTWMVDGTVTGGTVLVATAQGEIADVTMDGDAVMSVKPRKQVPYGVAAVLVGAVEQ